MSQHNIEDGGAHVSIEDLKALMGQMQGSVPEGPDRVQAFREVYDGLSMMFPFPEDGTLREAREGGVPGAWIEAPGAERSGAMLYLHGGGYALGSILSHKELVYRLSAASKRPGFLVDYRRAPENPFPAALDDAVAAYQGLLASGLKPRQVAILGDSAGGGLTMATLLALRQKNIPMPGAAVCLSPWADLTLSGAAHKERAARDPIVRREDLLGWVEAYAGREKPDNPLLSPVFGDLSGLPPVLIQVGTEETLYDDACMLATGLARGEGTFTFEAWPGMTHVFQQFSGMVPEGLTAIERIGAFMRYHCS